MAALERDFAIKAYITHASSTVNTYGISLSSEMLVMGKYRVVTHTFVGHVWGNREMSFARVWRNASSPILIQTPSPWSHAVNLNRVRKECLARKRKDDIHTRRAVGFSYRAIPNYPLPS